MLNRSSRWYAALALLMVITFAWACSGSPSGVDATPPPHDVSIVLAAPDAGPNAFSPANEVISLGAQSTVTWYNADFAGYGGFGTAHHLKADDGTSFDSGVIGAGGVFQATFTAPGTYTYHCELHEGMTGTVTVNP